MRLKALLAFMLLIPSAAQAQYLYRPISQWPIPAVGSTTFSSGDVLLADRSGVTYKLNAQFGGMCSSSQWVNSISNQNVPSCTQPGFSNISGFVGQGQLGGSYFISGLTINNNAATLPLKQTGTLLQIGNAPTIVTRVEADSFGSAAHFSAIRFDGTPSLISAVQNGDEIGGFNAWGAFSSVGVEGPQASIGMYADENFSSGHGGMDIRFKTTPIGSNVLAEVMRLTNAGTLGIGTTVPLASADVRGTLAANGTISNGTLFTVASGCGVITSAKGGATTGSFGAGQASCQPVINLPTAPNGWRCVANDLTHPANPFTQTASFISGCTLSATLTSADTVIFHAEGF